MYVNDANVSEKNMFFEISLTKITYSTYGKCSKILNTFLFLFFNKMLVFRTVRHKMLVWVANREDPDQTAS